MSNIYDYLVVGAGLFGATFAYEAAKRGKRVKVIEKRDHIAGDADQKTLLEAIDKDIVSACADGAFA